jgi:hypothetical protein
MKRIPLVLTLLIVLMLFSMSAAEASSRIRAGSCDVYQIARLDPVAKLLHLHAFAGGKPINSNDVTGFDLKASNQSSCKSEDAWATSGRWYPVAKTFNPEKDTLYYRDPGDLNNLKDIPTDLRLLSSDVVFKGDLTTVSFPNCLKMNSSRTAPLLDSADHRSHAVDKKAKPCPSTHPYRIPRASYLIHWPRNLTTSTPISIGSGQWGPAGQNMHADYLAGNQDEFNDKLIDLCLNNVRDSVDVADPACGKGP